MLAAPLERFALCLRGHPAKAPSGFFFAAGGSPESCGVAPAGAPLRRLDPRQRRLYVAANRLQVGQDMGQFARGPARSSPPSTECHG